MAEHDPERTRRVAAKARKSIMGHVQYIPHDYHDESSTAGQTVSEHEGMTSEGKHKELHMDVPSRMQLNEASARHEDSGGENLGGGTQGHDDVGSGGPHGDKHPSADPEESGDHNDPKHVLNMDPHHSDDGSGNEGEHGEEGAGRDKDLLGPNMTHGMVHSATVKKILGAYKRSK